MENLAEKVAYLKGLQEGLSIDESKPEAKLLNKIIEVLDDMASEVLAIIDTEDELQAQIDEIDEDLSFVEEFLFDEGDWDEDDFDCEDIECPNCGELIYLDADLLEDDEESIVCPSCGEHIELECEYGCDGCMDEDQE